MQGQQNFQADTVIQLTLESFIPVNHRLRKIDRKVDFSFVREITKQFYCGNNGRPSIDPEVFFRIILLGYLYNISSDVRLCEELRYNLAYRWFCKLNLTDKVPNHSSLSRIRDRLGLAVFQQFFLQIIQQCQAQGLVKGRHIMTDGTLFQANASLDSLVPREQAITPQPVTIRGLQAPTSRKISNATHVSRTDPDASLAFKKGTARTLKYKTHFTLDAESKVILAAKVTTGATHESQVYLAQIDAIQTQLVLNIREATADRAYGSGEIIQALLDQNITPNIPLFSTRSGRFDRAQPQEFIYESDRDRYYCQAGEYLTPYATVKGGSRHYHTAAHVCTHCPLQTSCRAKGRNGSTKRGIHRNIHQTLFATVAAQMQTSNFRAKLAERMWKVEGLISEAKQLHGLTKAKYRGLSKTQIQVYLIASVLNIKRLILLLIVLVTGAADRHRCYAI